MYQQIELLYGLGKIINTRVVRQNWRLLSGQRQVGKRLQRVGGRGRGGENVYSTSDQNLIVATAFEK